MASLGIGPYALRAGITGTDGAEKIVSAQVETQVEVTDLGTKIGAILESGYLEGNDQVHLQSIQGHLKFLYPQEIKWTSHFGCHKHAVEKRDLLREIRDYLAPIHELSLFGIESSNVWDVIVMSKSIAGCFSSDSMSRLSLSLKMDPYTQEKFSKTISDFWIEIQRLKVIEESMMEG